MLADNERIVSAAERLRFNGAGFHSHNAVQMLDDQGNIVRKVDVNVFSEEFPSSNHREAAAMPILEIQSS